MAQDNTLNYNIFALNTGGPNNSPLEYGYMNNKLLTIIETNYKGNTLKGELDSTDLLIEVLEKKKYWEKFNLLISEGTPAKELTQASSTDGTPKVEQTPSTDGTPTPPQTVPSVLMAGTMDLKALINKKKKSRFTQSVQYPTIDIFHPDNMELLLKVNKERSDGTFTKPEIQKELKGIINEYSKKFFEEKNFKEYKSADLDRHTSDSKKSDDFGLQILHENEVAYAFGKEIMETKKKIEELDIKIEQSKGVGSKPNNNNVSEKMENQSSLVNKLNELNVEINNLIEQYRAKGIQLDNYYEMDNFNKLATQFFILGFFKYQIDNIVNFCSLLELSETDKKAIMDDLTDKGKKINNQKMTMLEKLTSKTPSYDILFFNECEGVTRFKTSAEAAPVVEAETAAVAPVVEAELEEPAAAAVAGEPEFTLAEIPKPGNYTVYEPKNKANKVCQILVNEKLGNFVEVDVSKFKEDKSIAESLIIKNESLVLGVIHYGSYSIKDTTETPRNDDERVKAINDHLEIINELGPKVILALDTNSAIFKQNLITVPGMTIVNPNVNELLTGEESDFNSDQIQGDGVSTTKFPTVIKRRTVMQAQPNKANILDLCSKDIFIVKGFETLPDNFNVVNGSEFETKVELIKSININVCEGGLVCPDEGEDSEKKYETNFNDNKIPNSIKGFPFDHNGLSYKISPSLKIINDLAKELKKKNLLPNFENASKILEELKKKENFLNAGNTYICKTDKGISDLFNEQGEVGLYALEHLIIEPELSLKKAVGKAIERRQTGQGPRLNESGKLKGGGRTRRRKQRRQSRKQNRQQRRQSRKQSRSRKQNRQQPRSRKQQRGSGKLRTKKQRK